MFHRLSAIWSHPSYQPKDRLKMAVGFLLSPRATTDWLDYIAQTPFLEEALKQQPKLITKIFRPYHGLGLLCGWYLAPVQRGQGHGASSAGPLRRARTSQILNPALHFEGLTWLCFLDIANAGDS